MDEVHVGEARSLRLARRARGVDDHHRLVGLQGRERADGRMPEIREAPVPRAWRIDEQQASDARPGGEAPAPFAGRDREHRLGIGHDVGDVGGTEPRAEGDGDPAGADSGEDRDQVLQPVVEHHGDAVAAFQA